MSYTGLEVLLGGALYGVYKYATRGHGGRAVPQMPIDPDKQQRIRQIRINGVATPATINNLRMKLIANGITPAVSDPQDLAKTMAELQEQLSALYMVMPTSSLSQTTNSDAVGRKLVEYGRVWTAQDTPKPPSEPDGE